MTESELSDQLMKPIRNAVSNPRGLADALAGLIYRLSGSSEVKQPAGLTPDEVVTAREFMRHEQAKSRAGFWKGRR